MSALQRSRTDRALPGQTLVLFALMSVMLLAGLGLIIDAGYDYTQRRLMQNAADTAALQGARVIAQRSSSANPNVRQEVEEIAVSNGVPSAAQVECDYIDNSRNLFPVGDSGCENNEAIPVGVTGVRVRVSETHTPIVMRALGVMETGTSATAAAQIRALSEMQSADVPFAVCGMNAELANGQSFDILQTETVPAPSPRTDDVERVIGSGNFNSNVYSYDWTIREDDGDFDPLDDAPEPFIIYGTGIGDCLLGGWQGLADHDSPVITSDQTLPGLKFANVQNGATTGLAGPGRLDPEHTIDGTLGCRPNQAPDDCVLILPIVYNKMDCDFCSPETYASGWEAGQATLYFAKWGAFLMNDEGGGTYSGQLIKNYPIQATGKNYWVRTWDQPIAITLVELP